MRPDDARLLDILLAARRILRFVEGVGQEQFAADEGLQSAVCYQLLIIGEAARSLPEAQRARAPRIPWPEVVGL